MPEPVRLFISYARKDLEHLEALETHLANLKRQKEIEVWTDQKLQASTEWSPELLGRLRAAQIVVVLISPDMMASDFIHDTELTETLARHQRGEVRVVPVLVRPTDLKGHPLDQFQGLPRNFKPVVEWTNRDAAWVDVVKEMRTVIEGMPRLAVVASERQSLSEQYAAALRELNALQQEHAPESIVLQARKQATDLRDRLLQGDLQPADIIDGRFRLSQCLGQGGFASVWLAQRLAGRERVVLKILHSSLTSDAERLLRFRRGSEQMSRLNHPNILKVLEPYRLSSDADTGREHVRRHFVVLEWASRGDLAVWSRKQKHVPTLQEALQTGIDAASALAFAHAQGCIHRDVKPHNLLRMADGTLKLTDFDLAKLVNSTLLTRTGTAGTAFYIAPELQETLDGDDAAPVTESVDVYSLGWTLIAILKGKDITATDLIKRREVLQKLQVPETAQKVLLKAVELDPSDRYRTMTEFREALLEVRDTPLPEPPSVARTGPVIISPRASVLTPAQQLEVELALLPLQARLERLRALGKTGDPRLGLEKPENWIWLPPGEFRMGSDDGHDDEKPIHKVTLTRGFHLSRFPVTNHDFKPFIDAGGYGDKQWWSDKGWKFCQQEKLGAPVYWTDAQWNAPNQPVVGVSWYEADAFCRWMNTQPLSKDVTGPFRLPTEAEWEYAARGQEGRKYPWGNEDPSPERANYEKAGLNQTSPVGAFPLGASKEGVLDLAGNVFEWCGDWYGRYANAAQVDPTGPTSGSSRVIRGGSWFSDGSGLRAANRFSGTPGYRDGYVGFRVARGGSAGG